VSRHWPFFGSRRHVKKKKKKPSFHQTLFLLPRVLDLEEMSSWQDIQQHTFTAWINDYLKDRGMHINDMKSDLRDGVALLNLLEIISGKPIGKRWNKNPRVPNQKYENNQIAVEFVKEEGLKLVNIGGVASFSFFVAN